jgi:hypothetical protein
MGEAIDALVALSLIHVKGHKRVTAKGTVIDVDAYTRSLRAMSDLELEREANSTTDRTRRAQIANEARRRLVSTPMEKDPRWGLGEASTALKDKLNKHTGPTRVYRRLTAAEIADERQKNIWFKAPENPGYGPSENGDQLARRPDHPKGDLISRRGEKTEAFKTPEAEMAARKTLHLQSSGDRFNPARGKAVQRVFKALNNGTSAEVAEAIRRAREVFDGDSAANAALDVLEAA